MEDVFIRLGDIGNAILDFVSSGEYKNAIKDEDTNGFISGLGIAGTVIYARCTKYVCDMKEAERKDDSNDSISTASDYYDENGHLICNPPTCKSIYGERR